MKRSWKPRPVYVVRGGGVLILLLATTLAIFFGFRTSTSTSAASGDWPMYLGNYARTGFNGVETVINPTSAPSLKVHWVANAGGAMATEPVVANGHVYWGGWDGREHATDPTTGQDAWTAFLGQTASCKLNGRGILSTGAVETVTINGTPTPVEYVGGGDAQLYALNANTGTIIWSTRLGISPRHFLYSSPIFYQGSVYIGVSSFDDCPKVQGKVVQLDAVSGLILHSFLLVPNGCVGGGVWGSPAIDTATGMIYFATGDADSNGTTCAAATPFAVSVMQLNAKDLSYVDNWQIPADSRPVDSDFGSTPTLYQATINGTVRQMLGLINKNGIYYAFDRTNIGAGPVWQVQLTIPGSSPDHGYGSIASSAWDGTRLYIGGEATIVNGVTCRGSIQALDPSSGAIIWQRCLKKSVAAAVTAVPGVVVVDTGSSMLLVNAKTGKILFTYNETGGYFFWGAASISNGVLYQGNMDGNVYAFGL